MITKENTIDKVFFTYVAILLVFGLVALVSASGPLGYGKFNDSYFFVKRQFLNGIIPGLILFYFFLKIKKENLRKLSLVIFAGAIALLALVYFPQLGVTLHGAKSWINIFGFNFQPSEIAKLGLIIMAARLLSDTKRDLRDWQMGLLPILVLLSPILVLVLLQPDIGTLAIMLFILFGMLFVARVPKKYLVVMGLLCVVAFGFLVWTKPYRMQRMTIFMHPELDPQGVGYHINQAFLAIGSGGFWGRGFGQSVQKYQYLPEVNADSIFAVIAEELGFVLSSALIILFVLLGLRGLKIAKQTDDKYFKLIATGVVVWISGQAFLNIGAMVGVLPLTGVPLPLISHGGSALMAELGALGLVLNVSKKEI